MTRKYKTWNGLTIASLLGLIAIYGLLSLLTSGFLAAPDITGLGILLTVLFVAGIAYINLMAMKLQRRTKEFYIRKLLGARDGEIMIQILLESFVLTGFLAVSGIVLAELLTPLCGHLLGMTIKPVSLAFQVMLIILIEVLVGILSVLFPVRNFIRHIKNHLSRLAQNLH